MSLGACDEPMDARKAAGRPRAYDERVSSGYRMSPELHDRLKAAASERDVSVNWLITKAIEDYLGRLLPVNEIKWTR